MAFVDADCNIFKELTSMFIELGFKLMRPDQSKDDEYHAKYSEDITKVDTKAMSSNFKAENLGVRNFRQGQQIISVIPDIMRL